MYCYSLLQTFAGGADATDAGDILGTLQCLCVVYLLGVSV